MAIECSLMHFAYTYKPFLPYITSYNNTLLYCMIVYDELGQETAQNVPAKWMSEFNCYKYATKGVKQSVSKSILTIMYECIEVKLHKENKIVYR